ncbi:tetratricopeptide (TPR) repeat protein/DNA-binding CsgD family transcriptional regulator [Flavobacterium sp. PL11]|uniref:hypothetical protein n=1 Tax=Flavobacterium sp. PL11 TaxID=3071717 RepID=UPI002DFF70BA|nr:tetratricopeptide (TPR) repeat protein/DNA-binding CsgD family transcriptional regulator [Flavobacterium sp. PL11]
MNNFLTLLLLIIVTIGYSQNQVSIAETDKAYGLIFSNPTQAKMELDQLEKRAKDQKDSVYSIILNNKGVYFAVQTQMDSALIYFKKSSSLVNKTARRYVGTQTNIAVIYKKRGEIDKAIALLESNLVIADEKKYNTARATIYGELASCYSAKEWYKPALENLIQSIEIWGNENPIPTKKIAIEKQKLGNLYVKMANMPQALKIFKEIAVVFKDLGDLYNFYLVQITIADIYLELQQPKVALQLIQGAMPNLQRFNDKELLLFAFDREAKCIELLGNYPAARQQYKKAIAYGLQYDQIRTVLTVTQYGNLLLAVKDSTTLQRLKKQTENNEFKKLISLTSAYDQMEFYQWKEKYARLTNDVTTTTSSQEKVTNLKFLIKEKNNIFQIKELQPQHFNQNLQQDNHSDQEFLSFGSTTSIVLTLLLIMGIMAGMVLYKKSKSKNTDFSVTFDRLKNQQPSANDVQSIISEQQVNIKLLEKRLVEQVQNNLLIEIPLEKLHRNSEVVPEGNKSRKVLMPIKRNYTNIIEQFQTINPTFVSVLQNNYPILTKGEFEFCYLLKLNLTNKEIAHLLQISPESVITKKYRIVKKLQLDKEVDFQLWLAVIA